MKSIKIFLFIVPVCLIGFFLSSFLEKPLANKNFKFPYKQAGLNERQAAAHLLDRFTYGATPGQIDDVVNMGLEKWFQQQLDAGLPDEPLNQRLSKYDAIKLSNAEAVSQYPRLPLLRQMAIKDGVISKDSVDIAGDKKAYQAKILAYMMQKGFKLEFVLYQQFVDQKILRAAYSNNQLQEVMTDFWFNHFNVSITKPDCAQYIPAYERDVIRPNALGKFGQILLATAKSPAMLYYLDNFSSAGPATNNAGDKAGMKFIAENMAVKNDTNYQASKVMQQLQQNKKNQGLNENYAREVMELHTLGVDGGYTQSDVTQAAKVLTGWTVYPTEDYGYGSAIRKFIDKVGEPKLIKAGFVHDGDFFFAMNRHDRGEKTVLGKHFSANGGYQEGVDLLEMLAHHPSTAQFICHKLAVRFVSDEPPASIVDKMIRTFTDQDGDIKQVLITMVSSPEFWTGQALRGKTKSPFELAISAARNLDVNIRDPYPLFTWVDKMGQKMYFYQAPTGFPDKGEYWINSGALLNRMNFGLALASNRIQGIDVDLTALNNNHEPESAEAALAAYSKLIMPERDLDATIRRLTPMLTDPELMKKVDKAASATNASDVANANDMMSYNAPADQRSKPTQNKNNAGMLNQVVGIIIGSPEYQRR